MRSEMPETKSVVIRDKMKSALTKVWLAARARRAAKLKAQMDYRADYGVFAEIGMIDGLERFLDVQEFQAEIAVEGPSGVELVTLAIERLSPACMRTAITGLPQTVTVPDARTAEVFRAAIAASTKGRRSDRLVNIVVAAN
jgi:hypothetical protein